MKKEVKIPLYASIDDDVYEVIGVNNVEEIVKVKNFKSGHSFTMPINKWIIESFKLGTPATFDYKGNKISGEIIMKNGVKSISLYPDENYGGAIQRIIPLNLIDVTTSSSLMNKELFKDGGNISSENQEKIAKLEKVVNSDLIPEAIKNKAKAEIEKLKSETKAATFSKINPTYIKEITTRTGTNPVAVEKFFDDNNLGDNEALGLVTGLGRKQIEPLDFVSAITGRDGNQYAISIIKFLKNKESFKSEEESKKVGEIDYEQRQLNKKVYALLDKKLSGKADIGFKLRIVQVIGAALEDANYHSANYDFAKAIDSSITTKEEWYRSKIANPSKEDGSLGREISNLCGWDGEKIVACFDFALKMFGMPKIADVLNKVMTADEEEQEDDEDTITNTYKGLVYKVSKDMFTDGTFTYNVSVFEPKTNIYFNSLLNYKSNIEAISSAKNYIDSIKIGSFFLYGPTNDRVPFVWITDRNGTYKIMFNTESEAKDFINTMISHGFEYKGKPIEEESVKSEPKSDVSTVEIKDSRIGDKNISEISTYIPNREILSVKVKHNGKEIEIKGTDIFDGIYVDDKIIPSTRKPKAAPKMSRTQFEEETFEFEKGGKLNSKELEKVIDTTRSFFESNGVKYGQIDDLVNEIIIEPSTVLPKDSNLTKGSLDGMLIIYDKRTKIYEVSEYQAGLDGKDLYIFGEYKSLIPALKSLIKGNSTTGRKPMKIEKFAKGGYVRPAYNMAIVGDYSFKTKDGLGYEFRVAGFERAGDDTDSLYFDDSETTAKKELGTIIIKNSSWKNLANGKTIMAVSEKGVNGKLTKIK
jgi:hypothetical protein